MAGSISLRDYLGYHTGYKSHNLLPFTATDLALRCQRDFQFVLLISHLQVVGKLISEGVEIFDIFFGVGNHKKMENESAICVKIGIVNAMVTIYGRKSIISSMEELCSPTTIIDTIQLPENQHVTVWNRGRHCNNVGRSNNAYNTIQTQKVPRIKNMQI
uniref:Uncharacterized protein n=1 Tax=Strigamia maritima TaxID=126957 RepID=T1IK02_STRMM